MRSCSSLELWNYWSHYVRDKTDAEIAKMLGTSRGAIAVTLARAPSQRASIDVHVDLPRVRARSRSVRQVALH
jgi:hypothetical protein